MSDVTTIRTRRTPIPDARSERSTSRCRRPTPLTAPGAARAAAEPLPAAMAGGAAAPPDARLALDGASLWLNRVGEELIAWFKTLASAAVYATLIVTFGFQVARVEGQSMAPTLAGSGSPDRQQAGLPASAIRTSATS